MPSARPWWQQLGGVPSWLERRRRALYGTDWDALSVEERRLREIQYKWRHHSLFGWAVITAAVLLVPFCVALSVLFVIDGAAISSVVSALVAILAVLGVRWTLATTPGSQRGLEKSRRAAP
jgi:hypothetical protein